jgi:N-acetylmuramoyl-L-alanine amidase
LAKRSHILFVLLFFIFEFPVTATAFVLVIDPGHGGRDAGAVGRRGREKDINLAVSRLLGQYVANEHPDVKVVYTRTQDVFVGLDERADIANRANANLFISIHTNAVDRRRSNVRGAEVFTFGITRNAESLEVAKKENSVILLEENHEEKYEGFDPTSAESYIMFEFMVNLYADQSISFASMVQNELVRTARRSDRGVKQAGFLVLRKSSMPRILVELDFISNPEAENYLLSTAGQRTLARSIANAFAQYKKDFDRRESITVNASATERQIEALPANNQQSVQQVQTAASGRIYKVQVLATAQKLPDNSRELKGHKADYYIENNLYKYTIGESSDLNEINQLRRRIAGDFREAFVIAFENGIKVPIR